MEAGFLAGLVMVENATAEFRCYATLLFADLCDYTSLAEALDPEEVAPLLRRVRARVEEVARKHHGTVNEWRGDGVLCIFGIPLATEEDPKHAIEAALEMHEVVKGLEQGLPGPAGFEVRLHTGIDSGVVFARQRDGVDGYDLIGDAVNTAARLCSRAERDEVWVSRPTLEGFQERFETQRMESLQLKGKKDAVQACRVLARSEIATRFAASQRRGLTPLVGRDYALASLEKSLKQAAGGALQLVSIVGSPGIGKTRAMEELKRRIPPEIDAFEGHCERKQNAAALQPFIDVMRQLFRLHPGVSQLAARKSVDEKLREIDQSLSERRDVLLHLAGVDPLEGSPAQLPEQVQRSFVSVLVHLFKRLSQKRPLVLLLDDWQWADDVSREVLGTLLRELHDAPCMVVLASRDMSDPLQASGGLLALAPLTHDESARVIAAILPFSLNLGLTQTIHERAGGNPLFLEELCRALPSDVSSSREDLAGSRVPSTLRGIIQVRIERLPDLPARVLHAAAVIGGEPPYWLLAKVSETADLDDALRVLVEADLVHPANAQGSYRFKHWTTREVVYESVRLPERRRLHAKIAEVLDSHAREQQRPLPYEELAYHLAGGGDHERAAHFAELAGDRASSTSSLDHARQHYRAAFSALEKLPQSAELERRWIAIVDKWAAASLYSPAEEHLELIRRAGERALRLDDLVSAARADYWLSWFCYALGDLPLATQYCRSALARAEAAHDQRLTGQLVLSLGQSLAAAGEYGEALAHLASGLDTKRRSFQTRHDAARRDRRAPLAFAYALACKGLVHGDLGQFRDAYGCFDEALEVLQGTGHAVEGSCLGLLGMVQLLQGRWQDALETATRAQATAERVNGPYVFAMSKTVSGYARWVLERSPTALAELLQAVKWMEGRGIRLFISFNYAYLADALAAAGDYQQAQEYAQRALARSERADHLGEPMAHRTLARIASHDPERYAEAHAHLDRAMSSARSRQSAREVALTSLEVASLHMTRGEREQAARALVAARLIFGQLAMDHYQRRAHEVLPVP